MANTKDSADTGVGAPQSQRRVELPEPGFISEGVAQEVEANGSAINPATGRVATVADLPKRRQEAYAARRRAERER